MRSSICIFLLLIVLLPFHLWAQGPLRSATIAVLRGLGLPDAKALAGQLQIVNAHIRDADEPFQDDRTLYFSLLYRSYYGRAGAGHEIARNFLDQQMADGFIPAGYGSLRPVSPFLAQVVLLTSKERNAFTWLQEAPAGSEYTYYQRLQQYLDFWLNGRDSDSNGLPASAGDPLFFSPFKPDSRVESVALSCYLYRECKAMIRLAHQLGRPADKEYYQKRSRALAESLNRHLWDESAGWYFDREESNGQMQPGISIAGLLPLFAGMAPYERAERLVDQHLKPDSPFRQAYLLPLHPNKNDRATVWIPANYMVFQGLMDYGYRDQARELAYRTFELVFAAGPSLWGFYDGVTGRGLEPEAQGGWAALAYLMPWEYELNYTPSTLSWQPLVPLAPQYLGVKWPGE